MNKRGTQIDLDERRKMRETHLHVRWFACFVAAASTSGIAQTTGIGKPAAGAEGVEAKLPAMSELSPSVFKQPPALYRPIASLGGHGNSSGKYETTVPSDNPSDRLAAIVAVDKESGRRIDLRPMIQDQALPLAIASAAHLERLGRQRFGVAPWDFDDTPL